MTDGAAAPRSSAGDASSGMGDSAAAPDDEIKPPADKKNDQGLEPLAKRSRFHQWGAIVSQWGAIVAAIIAAIAAAITAIVSANTSASTLRSEAHRAAVLAERSELKSAYVDYHMTLYDIDDRAYRIDDFLMHRDLKDPIGWGNREHQHFSDLLTDYSEVWLKWVHSERAVELIAGPSIEAIEPQVAVYEDAVNGMINNISALFDKSGFDYVVYCMGAFDVIYNRADAFEASVKIAAQADLKRLGYGEN